MPGVEVSDLWCKDSTSEDNPYRPFCSERCKLVDLGRWLDGGYALPGPPAPPDGGEPGDPAER